MELSELDRLEQSVKRAFERIERLERERTVLTSENSELKNRLVSFQKAPTPSRIVPEQPTISSEQLAQIKHRINHLIERIGELERNQ